jgi:hypothetical protein
MEVRPIRLSPSTLFRITFLLSILGLALVTALYILVAGVSGPAEANTISQKITGTGDVYTRHGTTEAFDQASAVNSTVYYEMNTHWDDNTPGRTFETSFIVVGATSKGGFRNQYVVKSAGAGYKHVYRVTAITGDFVGSGDISLTFGEDGAPSLDSFILMDSRSGNATFQGRITKSVNGRPSNINSEDTDAVGKLLIESYLNITQPIKEPEDWLAFCEALNEGLPEGFAIISNQTYQINK